MKFVNCFIGLIVVNFLIIRIQSDENCIIGGVEADSCVNSKYIFNGTEYTFYKEFDLPIGTVMEFGENTTVNFERSAIIHFHCNASTEYVYYIQCKQIIVNGVVNSNSAYFEASLDMKEFLNVNDKSPIIIFFGEITNRDLQSNDYLRNSTSLTWPLFYLNITTNEEFNCSYYSTPENDRLYDVYIDCMKKPISRPFDINVTYSFCDDQYTAFDTIIYSEHDNEGIPFDMFYVKNYIGLNPNKNGLASYGFYFRIYPGFDFTYNITNILSYITTKKFNEECGPLFKVMVSYKFITPYGVIPDPNLPSDQPPSTIPNIEKNNISSAFKLSFSLSFIIANIIIYLLL